jgi:hypothetical protein
MPLYQSTEDPAGQQPRKVLVDDSVLKFGRAGDNAKSLLGSDQGFPLYFLKVDGGVRVRGQPLIFPTGPRKRFELEDFSCSVIGAGSTVDVLCRSKEDGQLYRSRLGRGGLVSFEIRCFDEITRICHYELAGGAPIRPTKFREQ